jgi:hypothetical protein
MRREPYIEENARAESERRLVAKGFLRTEAIDIAPYRRGGKRFARLAKPRPCDQRDDRFGERPARARVWKVEEFAAIVGAVDARRLRDG